MKTYVSKFNVLAWVGLAGLSAYAYSCLEQDTVSCFPEGWG